MNYAKYIDHTILKMDASKDEVIQICKEAKENNFFSVCVNSSYLPLVKKELEGSEVKLCSVIGFPLGASLTSVKAYEAKEAIKAGANEIDMVINVGFLKSNDLAYVKEDILAVKQACGEVLLKVIFETCLLSDEEIVKLCKICKELKVDFVKTSTGFSKSGASIHAVKLMRKEVGEDIGVKASGGIKSQEDAKNMIEAGANRLGSSNGVCIVNGQSSTSAY